jgi:TRAP-type mannitol/chloroaromatic compound transport system substrate-binding protein
VPLSSAVDALRAANDKLLDELAKKNPLSKEIIKSRHDYLQKIRAWTNISDKSFGRVLYFFKLMRNCSSLPGSCQPV